METPIVSFRKLSNKTIAVLAIVVLLVLVCAFWLWNPTPERTEQAPDVVTEFTHAMASVEEQLSDEASVSPPEEASRQLADADQLFVDAILEDQVEMVRAALGAGANPNLVIDEGAGPVSALALAVYGRNQTVARMVLAAGADPNLTFFGGNTALHLAVKMQASGMVDELLQFGANPSIADDQGLVPAQMKQITPAIAAKLAKATATKK